jgi:radical SAM superfamily enzyme
MQICRFASESNGGGVEMKDMAELFSLATGINMDEKTLHWLNRCHDFNEYRVALERSAGRGFEICTHLIHGFPGESRESFLAAHLFAAGGFLKIHRCMR